MQTQWEQEGKHRGRGTHAASPPLSSSSDVWRRLCLEWRMCRRKAKKGVSFSFGERLKDVLAKPFTLVIHSWYFRAADKPRPCLQPRFPAGECGVGVLYRGEAEPQGL